MAAAPSLIFITGGVRSGKSRFAEQIALEMAAVSGGELHYIATGVPFDSEMRERIKKHRKDREKEKQRWNTIEQSTNIGDLAQRFCSKDILLLDCVTTLLNNELYSSNQTEVVDDFSSIIEKIINGIKKIKKQTLTMIVVSNEVFSEPILANKLVFDYKRLLGKIHQRLVEEADQAYLVEAGVPIAMKEVPR